MPGGGARWEKQYLQQQLQKPVVLNQLINLQTPFIFVGGIAARTLNALLHTLSPQFIPRCSHPLHDGIIDSGHHEVCQPVSRLDLPSRFNSLTAVPHSCHLAYIGRPQRQVLSLENPYFTCVTRSVVGRSAALKIAIHASPDVFNQADVEVEG